MVTIWIFANFGLIMPAAVEMDVADPKFTEGKYDLQVRGRVEEHVRYFMDTYMEPGTFHNEIQKTPQNDYNLRFYTTHEAFAQGLVKAVMDIDYRKFKPTAERFSWGHKYHDVLNSIWGVVLNLAPAGGIYGPKSADNPKGYGPAKKYMSSDMDWWKTKPTLTIDDFDGYIFTHVEEKEDIIKGLNGIPADQWEDMVSEHEWSLIKVEAARAIRKERKAALRHRPTHQSKKSKQSARKR